MGATVVFMSWDMVLAKRWQLVLNLIRSKIPIRYIRCLIVGGFDSLFFTWTMNVLADECCLVRNAAHSHADTCQIADVGILYHLGISFLILPTV